MKKLILIIGLLLPLIIWAQSKKVTELDYDNTVHTNDIFYSIDQGTTSKQMRADTLLNAMQDSVEALETVMNDSLASHITKIAAGSVGWAKSGDNVYLDSSDDSTGLGTSSPTEKLDIVGNARVRFNALIADSVKWYGTEGWIWTDEYDVMYLGDGTGTYDLATLSGSGLSSGSGITIDGSNNIDLYGTLTEDADINTGSKSFYIHNTSGGNTNYFYLSGANAYVQGNNVLFDGYDNFQLSSDSVRLFYNTTFNKCRFQDYRTGANILGIEYNADYSSTLLTNPLSFTDVRTAKKATLDTLGISKGLIVATGNIRLGSTALNSLTIGDYNVGIGTGALYTTSTTNNNIGIGYNALYSNNGHNNVAIGKHAGYNCSSCEGGVFLGYYAGSVATNSQELWIENSNADKFNSLIWGDFEDDTLRLNANVRVKTEFWLRDTTILDLIEEHGGSASAAGSNYQFQYYDGGSLAASANFGFQNSTDTITMFGHKIFKDGSNNLTFKYGSTDIFQINGGGTYFGGTAAASPAIGYFDNETSNNLPAFTWQNDNNTGWARPKADRMKALCGGDSILILTTDSIIANDSIYLEYLTSPTEYGWMVMDSTNKTLFVDSLADASFGLYDPLPIDSYLADRKGGELRWYYAPGKFKYGLGRMKPTQAVTALAWQSEQMLLRFQGLDKDNRELRAEIDKLKYDNEMLKEQMSQVIQRLNELEKCHCFKFLPEYGQREYWKPLEHEDALFFYKDK